MGLHEPQFEFLVLKGIEQYPQQLRVEFSCWLRAIETVLEDLEEVKADQ